MAVSPQLSNSYNQARQRLQQQAAAAATMTFGQQWRNQAQGTRDLLALVTAAMTAVVNLVNGYLALATGTTTQALDSARYTVAALRRADPAKVYSQPWAALTVALQNGETLDAARLSADARLTKLVSTDLQLAQTHSARDWMVHEPSVTGWLRVPDATACSLCLAASGRVYHTSDLMPIHEHCGCGVEPIMERSPQYAAINANVRVVEGDIGPRLMAADWAA